MAHGKYPRFLVVFLFLFALTLPAARADHVAASLISRTTSLQPGHPFTVALRLVHEPHWHSYWINAGTGYPTKITWKLPDGWTTSDIRWPTPKVLRDAQGNVTGNGYDGDLLLPVEITPPADLPAGRPITLRAKAEWLMCEATCVPGEAVLSLTLPVSADTPAEDARWHNAFAQIPAPRPPTGWKIAAGKNGTRIELALAGGPEPLAHLHFFSSDGLIQYDEPQNVSSSPGQIRLNLPVSPSFEGKADRLVGVLAYGDSDRPAGLAIDVPVGAVPPAAEQPGSQGVLPTLVLAFLGGLILNLMPCVFPVLGIKIMGFVNQAGADRRKVTWHGLAFTGGVLLSFWILAGLLAALRAGGSQLGWGFQLQSPAFVFFLAALLFVFALNLSGVFEFGLRATAVGSSLQGKQGYAGSFLTGVLATVVATPCSAPFLAPALGAALALPATASFAIFTTIALGLSAPYLVLSLFPGAVRILPRPGAWMETFKQLMAFPLYGTVGYLIWVLAGQTTEAQLLNVLFGLTAIALAVWLYGRWTAPGSRPGRVRFAFVGGGIVFALGLFLGWPQAASSSDIAWGKWSPDAVAQAQAAGKTVYVDFTARWCATCQANKRLVFHSGEVTSLFRKQGVVALEADWTNHDPAITAELAKYGRSAVPFNLVYKPGTAEPIILPELLTASAVLDALR